MNRKPFIIALLVLLAAGLLAGLIAANLFLARSVPGGRELLMPWWAARAEFAGTVSDNFGWLEPVVQSLPDGRQSVDDIQAGLLAGPLDPYDERVAAGAQSDFYRRPAAQGEYPFRSDLPLYLIVLMSPFGFFSDFTLLRAVWMAFSELALLAVVFLSMRMAGWQSGRLSTGILLFGGALSFFGVYPLLSGSMSIWLLLIFFGVLASLQAGLDELAGALLVLAACKWEITGLVFLLLLVWTVAQRRWRVWTGFFMTLIVLIALVTIFSPNWEFNFLAATVANLRAEWGLSTWKVFPQRWLAWLLSAALLGLLVVEYRATAGRDLRRLFWVMALALTFTPLMGWQVQPADYAILIPALVVVSRVADDRWGRIAGLLPLLVLLAAWWFYGGTLALNSGHPRAGWFLALPGAMLMAMYWLRWWALAPPRTWHDRVKEGRLNDLA